MIDTNIWLELALLELSRTHPMWQMFTPERIDTRPKREQFVDFVGHRFGAVEITFGYMLELDRQLETSLRNRRSERLRVEEFWLAYRHAASRFVTSSGGQVIFDKISLGWDESNLEDQYQLGVVDAHSLQLLERDDERWFITIDGDLEAHALARAEDRVLNLDSILET